MKLPNASRFSRIFLSAAFAGVLALAPTAAWAICGDGNIEVGEECDDGNTLPNDCCDAECQLDQVESFCTDGNQCTFDFCDGQGNCLSFPNQGAECDDGNSCSVGDFCNSDGFCTSDSFLENGDSCSDDALCGGIGQCFSGFCFGDPADCSGYGVCNSAVCNQQTGSCEVTQLEDGTPCDNPSTCTDPGECTNGECQQPPRDCSHLADACNDAFCDVEAGGCYAVPKEDGTPCDDTNGCTDPGSCKAGDCETTPKDCSSFGDQCNDAACDPKTEDGCFAAPKENGTGCNDDLNCTTGDSCTDGSCDGTPIDCSEFADDCNTAFCDPQTGECDTAPVEGPASCDDGNPCTTDDSCRGGICAGQLIDCSNFDSACATGVCNVQTGQCEASPNEDGGECDDGDKCTNGDQCVSGECAGTPLDCSEFANQCNLGICNGDTGGCESVAVGEPTSCDDGNPCTENDACSDGVCEGDAKDCSSLDSECATGQCGRTGECVAVPDEDGSACNDGDNCTTGDECTSGECGGTPKDCSASGGNCLIGECNPDTGQCVGEQAEDGTPCDDGHLCTQEDTCTDGECFGDPITCKPSLDPCKQTSCNSKSGECEEGNADNGTDCSDGSLCTTSDMCTDGSCGGTATDCSGQDDACNTGSCDTETGGCVKLPRENGTSCSDSNECTTGDSCTAGTCTSGPPKDCSDLDAPCKTGVCNPQSGACEAVNAQDSSPCDDGAFCTATDTCTGGVCGGTGDPCPGDLVCDGQCDETGDTCHAASGTTCESDGNPCTDDVCDGEGSCVAEANDGSCDDGLYCTTGDRCADKACIGDATCPQTDGCGDTCDEVNDACRTCGHPFSNARCIVNAIFVLQGALSIRECELCTCDVDSSGDVMATDALLILRTCTNLPTSLDCPIPGETTTTTTTTTTINTTTTTLEGGCEAALHNVVFQEKYTCVQTFTGGEPFCADLAEQDAIKFTHLGDGVYQVRDEPDTGFLYTGVFDCTTFTWNASEPGEYTETGVWTFANNATTFSGSSAYVADNLSYAGACNETGVRAPSTPPDPTPIPPCE